MPTYEYRCNACGREFEYVQRMVDDDKVTCEACGKDALEKLISRTAFQFKGGGWYKDLYSSAKPESGGGDKPASTSSDTSSTPATPAAPSTPAAAPATPAATPSTSSGASGGSSGGSSSGGSSSGGSSGSSGSKAS